MKKTVTLLSTMTFCLILLLQGYRLYLDENISESEILLERVRTERAGLTDSEALSNKNDGEKMALLDKTLKNEGLRFYKGSRDEEFLKVGREITALIKSSGLTIQSYKLKPQEKSVTYQYQLTCEVRQLMNVLEKLRKREKYLEIVNLSIKNSTRPAVISLVLSPVIYPDSDSVGIIQATLESEELITPYRDYSPLWITQNLFSIPVAAPEVVSITAPIPTEDAVEEPEIPIAPSWLKYIGTSSSGETKVYFLMDERSNKTMKMSPGESQGSYTLTQVQPDRLCLQIKGETIYVYK